MDVVVNTTLAELPQGSRRIPHQSNFYPTLLTCLGYPKDTPPVADLLRRYHGLEGQWLVASPMYWQATHNDATIVACGSELQLSEQDSRLWFSEFKELVAAENLVAHYHDAYTWLLACNEKPLIEAISVYSLQHQPMMLALRNLDKTLFWQRFITEIQMFFSSLSLNQSHIGPYPINGIWFWGGGELHKPMGHPIVVNKKMRKLAELLSTNVHMFNEHLLPKNAIFLFDALNQQELITLQKRLQKHKVHWYWNNMAYSSQPITWLQRLGVKKRD